MLRALSVFISGFVRRFLAQMSLHTENVASSDSAIELEDGHSIVDSAPSPQSLPHDETLCDNRSLMLQCILFGALPVSLSLVAMSIFALVKTEGQQFTKMVLRVTVFFIMTAVMMFPFLICLFWVLRFFAPVTWFQLASIMHVDNNNFQYYAKKWQIYIFHRRNNDSEREEIAQDIIDWMVKRLSIGSKVVRALE